MEQKESHKITAFVIMSLLFWTSNCLPADTENTSFIEGAEFDKSVPSPEAVTGFPVGQRAVTYEQLVKYLKVVSAASDRVKMAELGRTHEGRSLYYLIISSKDNLKKLEQIKEDSGKLADPRKLKGDDEAKKIIDSLPAIAYLNYGIHGDELSSTDAALYIIYHLAASKDKQTQKLLNELVIIIDPMMNPDGRERFLGQIFQMTGAVENTDIQAMQHTAMWPRGRGNHYLFDMNRDWLILVQPEVRSTSKLLLEWHPQLLVDSHEQGPLDNYLFGPPNEPVNIQLSESINKWRKFFSSEQAKAFNRHGWSYYTRDWYSDWGPVYTDAYANLVGTIGILYEQARANSAEVKQPTGKILTYRESVQHHIVSTFANLQTLCENRRGVLTDFYEDKKFSIAEQKNDKVFILPPAKDSAGWQQLVELIKSHGIEVQFAAGDFNAINAADMFGKNSPARKFAAGACIVRPAQPRRRLLLNLLEFDPHLTDDFLLKERKDLENRKETLLYDTSAWSLPLCFGLESYWAERISDAKLVSAPPAKKSKTASVSKGQFGYIIDFTSADIYRAMVRLLDNDCHPRVATETFKINGKEFSRGAVILRGNENPEKVADILKSISADFDVEITPVETALVEDGYDLGSSRYRLLASPRVAIAAQWPVWSNSFGSLWFLVDRQLRLKSSPFNIQNIDDIDIRKYNVLVLPESQGLEKLLDDKDLEKIKSWVENGGTLIAVGSSAAYLADPNKKISSVRLRQDVLGKLDEYEEAVERERAARQVRVDANLIWDNKEIKTGGEGENKKSSKPSEEAVEKLKRDDRWQKIFSPHGTFLSAELNPQHWLAFGLDERIPVLFYGDEAFMSKYPVATPVRLSAKNNLRISGLLWPEAAGRVANSAYATVEQLGKGQVVLFAVDPTYRFWFPGQERLLENAILLGPGLGTVQPLPW